MLQVYIIIVKVNVIIFSIDTLVKMSSFGTQLFGFTNHLKMYAIFSHVVKFTVYIIYFRHEHANDI